MPHAARAMKGHSSIPVMTSSKNPKMEQSFTSFTLDNVDLKAIDLKEVVYVAPYYKTSDGQDIGISNIFEARPKGEQGFARFEKVAEEYGLIILGQDTQDKSLYRVSCTKESRGNALEMANLLYESGVVDYAAPSFLVELAELTNDTWFHNQWGLYNSPYSAFDINYNEAMNSFSFPNIGNIVVAVIDDGIYNNHLDLPLYTPVSMPIIPQAPHCLHRAYFMVIMAQMWRVSSVLRRIMAEVSRAWLRE